MESPKKERYLVFGRTGWIGQQIIQLLGQDDALEVFCALSRLEYRDQLEREINEIAPHYIINCAGVTGRPNVDWCEDHKSETIRTNVIGTLNLFDVANTSNIHVTNFATGCIYQYDSDHPLNSGKGFAEEEPHNFKGSFYSKTKSMVEELSVNYPNVLTLRLRMPLSDDLHPRNFITKITKYEKVVNIPNSMTVLSDLLPVAIDMTKRKLKGIYNFTNPGAISHNEILELYKKYIDQNFKWQNFTEEEQAKVLKAGRSNNLLDTTKLTSLYPNISPIHEAAEQLFIRMASKIQLESLPIVQK